MVKCKCCGREINYLNVSLFDIRGSDSFEKLPLYECDDNAVYIEPGQVWTGYELSEETVPYLKEKMEEAFEHREEHFGNARAVRNVFEHAHALLYHLRYNLCSME